MEYTSHRASPNELARIWEKDVAANPGEERWERWRLEYIGYNKSGRAVTFVVTADGDPVGQGTILLDPSCSAIRGRTALCDGVSVGNINALRIEKAHEGQGHISRMVRGMEEYAAAHGLRALTIGVEAAEARNLAIYLHWGYTKLVHHDIEDGELVLYYRKEL
ncbi:MAG: GNAT family N-acetyltransferase [Clostridia bacterium]|nr:GNAT family N-acetyltransferase [Clostridia bacterium]